MIRDESGRPASLSLAEGLCFPAEASLLPLERPLTLFVRCVVPFLARRLRSLPSLKRSPFCGEHLARASCSPPPPSLASHPVWFGWQRSSCFLSCPPPHAPFSFFLFFLLFSPCSSALRSRSASDRCVFRPRPFRLAALFRRYPSHRSSLPTFPFFSFVPRERFPPSIRLGNLSGSCLCHRRQEPGSQRSPVFRVTTTVPTHSFDS